MDKNFKTLGQKEQVKKATLEDFKSLTASGWLVSNVSRVTHFVMQGETQKAKELLFKSLEISSHHKVEIDTGIIEYNDQIITIDEYVEKVINFIDTYMSMLKEEQDENDKKAQKLERENFVYHSETDFPPKYETNQDSLDITNEKNEETEESDKNTFLSKQDELFYIDNLLKDTSLFENSFVQKLEKRKDRLEHDIKIEEISFSIQVAIENLDQENKIQDVVLEENETKEYTPEELFENICFKEGINAVVLHGQNLDTESGENMTSKFDLDNYSALQILNEVGVKYRKNAKQIWIHPQTEIKTDAAGRVFYIVEGKKQYIPTNSLIIDVGKGNGISKVGKSVVMIDHHGKDSDNNTSATKIILDTLKKNDLTKDNVQDWMEKYEELVTKIDNLSMEIPKYINDFKKEYPKSLYSMANFLHKKNPLVLIDLFKKHPNISLDNLTEEELDYVVGYKERESVYDYRENFKNIKIFSKIQTDKLPKSFYEPFTLRDVSKNQEVALRSSIESLDYHTQKMYAVNKILDRSPILGKTIFIDDGGDYNNHFNAVTAYGIGYETMIIHNKKDNSIFISSKNKDGLKSFAEKFKIYNDNGVLIRDSMFILRDSSLGKDKIDYVKNAIIHCAQLQEFSLEKILE